MTDPYGTDPVRTDPYGTGEYGAIQTPAASRRSMRKAISLTIVAAVTSNVLQRGPTSVFVRAPEGGLTVDSVVLLNHIRTIDKRRLGKRLGALRSETTKEIDQAVMISLALVEI